MGQPLPDTDLIVSTPERVSFDYQVAGLGTRGIAQILDLLLIVGLLIAMLFVASAVGQITQSSVIATLIEILATFAIVFGYFWISEALFRGQTLGKRAFRLRVVGDRGEPLTWVQAGIRNVVRIVDFLPYGYGVGMIVLFANGRGKRLGDLAAGTIVVKDSDHVALWQLSRPAFMRPAPPPPSGPPDGSAYASAAPPPPPPGYAPVISPYAAATPAELFLRRIDPDLRRFVSAYARRRPQLTLDLRVQLASTMQSSLRIAMPDVFAQQGPLAVLDYLSDLEGQ
ncbi:MAG TPA: RDD family protein [Candidatus Dormibacteraeota bacterium]|nr:RDD family protein [Candidatus Dormibacteraeota bacterium]